MPYDAWSTLNVVVVGMVVSDAASDVVGEGESEVVVSSDSVVVGMFDATSELFVLSGREVVTLDDAIVREPEVVVDVEGGGTVRAITDDADDREDFGAVVDPKFIDIGPGKGGLAPGGGPILCTVRGGSSKVIDNRDRGIGFASEGVPVSWRRAIVTNAASLYAGNRLLRGQLNPNASTDLIWLGLYARHV
jgi:hypothetical protein